MLLHTIGVVSKFSGASSNFHSRNVSIPLRGKDAPFLPRHRDVLADHLGSALKVFWRPFMKCPKSIQNFQAMLKGIEI
jgi:hypothetical protein